MKKLILVTLVLCMALSACTKAEVGKAPTAESAAASSAESTASGGKSAASEVSLPEKPKTAAHVTKTLSSGVVVDADVTMPESMQKTELPEMKGTGHEVAHEGLSEVFFGGAEVESTVTEIAITVIFLLTRCTSFGKWETRCCRLWVIRRRTQTDGQPRRCTSFRNTRALCRSATTALCI